MTIFLLRASHGNEFELQNYAPLAKNHDIRVVTSRHSLTNITLPTTKLWSPTDLPNFPYRRQILNRLIGGEQWLPGFEQYLNKSCYHVSKHGNKNIVHTAETYTPYTHQAVQLRKVGKIAKLICTCWETIPHNNEKFGRLRTWKQEAREYVDLFHTPTQRAKDALIKEGVNPKKIKVIPYGVDLTRFRPVKHKENKRPLILTVARLEKEKGMVEIEAAANAIPQADFLVVGQGNYLFTAPNITTRAVPYQDIHRVYQKADIFFFPSRPTPTWEEQYGMALVEAMASGLPIVTNDSGAIPEVVGDAAMIVSKSNPDYASALNSLLNSPTLRKRYSKRALARAKKLYDHRLVAQKLLTLYR